MTDLPDACGLCDYYSRNGGHPEACTGYVQRQTVGETGGIVLVGKPCRCPVCRPAAMADLGEAVTP